MKIKYGIDLGTTNSGIAFINKGESVIVKKEEPDNNNEETEIQEDSEEVSELKKGNKYP